MAVVLGIEIQNRTSLGGEMKRELNRIRKMVMQDVAREFAEDHIVPHFTSANRARFSHEKRNDVYLNEIKRKNGDGQGKYVDLQLSGRSKRQVMATIRITATKDKATVRTTAPGYFAKPFVGTFMKQERQPNGKIRQVLKRVTRQPDKVKELGTIDRKDVDTLTRFALRRGRMYWREAKAERRKRIT
jgi:hypothetical protein